MICSVTRLVAAGALLAFSVVFASISPTAGQDATPVALAFPDDTLGQQATWTWSVLSNSAPVSEAELEKHLAPEALKQAPAAQISAGIAQLQQTYGPFSIEPNSIVVSANEPPTQLSYVITGKGDVRFQVSVALDPASGLLAGFLISPAPSTATPVASPLPAGITDHAVSFTSGADTIFGSFMAPATFSSDTKHPAALIISGSGPTDRNGDSPGYTALGTNRNLAITLADAGIPSLRYDKVGSGETGLASHANGSGIDYQLFAREVKDATAFLASQPGVDPARLIIVGHSEGALFALVQAQQMVEAGTPPAGLILVSPLAIRYLDILQQQIGAQAKAAVSSGQMTQDAADKLTAELTTIIDSLRSTGKMPNSPLDPQLAPLFAPANIDFLVQIDKIDPAEVAASLPKDLPVLVLLGEKDSQVTPGEVQHLMDGFAKAGNTDATLVNLPNANHVLRIVEGTPNPSVDYRNPDLPFSPDAITAIDSFVTKYGWSAAS